MNFYIFFNDFCLFLCIYTACMYNYWFYYLLKIIYSIKLNVAFIKDFILLNVLVANIFIHFLR